MLSMQFNHERYFQIVFCLRMVTMATDDDIFLIFCCSSMQSVFMWLSDFLVLVISSSFVFCQSLMRAHFLLCIILPLYLFNC